MCSLLQEYVVALLGILKTGAAYTPVELAYPVPLLAAVLEVGSRSTLSQPQTNEDCAHDTL